jgi:starch synthase (maltosyl-transferring)
MIFAFSKESDDGTDKVLVVVNLDPNRAQDATIHLDVASLELPLARPYLVHDELSGETFEWVGADPYVRLDPSWRVAHVLSLNLAAGQE